MATNRRVYSTAAATAPAGTAMASSTALRKKSKSSRTRSESLLTFASAARNSASPADGEPVFVARKAGFVIHRAGRILWQRVMQSQLHRIVGQRFGFMTVTALKLGFAF